MARFTPDLMGRLTIAYKISLRRTKARPAYDKQIAAAAPRPCQKKKRKVKPRSMMPHPRNKPSAPPNFPLHLWLRKCVRDRSQFAKHHAMLARSLAAFPQYRQDAVRHSRSPSSLTSGIPPLIFSSASSTKPGPPWRAVPLYRRVLEIDPEHTKKPSSASPPWKTKAISQA